MKIFLTGGTGFIGKSLIRTLVQRGWKVISLVRNPNGAEAKAIQALGTQLVRGDVTDRESMRETMKGVDVVIHNAGWYKFGITKQDHDTMRAINVHGTENTLGLAIELGVSKVVYTSTILAFGQTGDLVADESFQRCTPLSPVMSRPRRKHIRSLWSYSSGVRLSSLLALLPSLDLAIIRA
jgi:dihydroflavonol-4-reductase